MILAKDYECNECTEKVNRLADAGSVTDPSALVAVTLQLNTPDVGTSALLQRTMEPLGSCESADSMESREQWNKQTAHEWNIPIG